MTARAGLAQRQFPGILVRGSVTVGTFHFDGRQRGRANIAVSVHGGGQVAVLTQQSRLLAVDILEREMHVLADKLEHITAVGLLRIALFIKGAAVIAVSEGHKSLIGMADAPSRRMAGSAGVDLNAGQRHAVDCCGRVARALHGMRHEVPGAIPGQGLVPSFIVAFVAVKRVAGGAAHAPKMASVLIALAAQVTGIAVAQIGKGGLLGLFRQLCHIHFRNLLQLLGELSGEAFAQVLHVVFVGIRPEARRHAVLIVKIMIAVDMIMIPGSDAPAPGDGLHLARIGVHV